MKKRIIFNLVFTSREKSFDFLVEKSEKDVEWVWDVIIDCMSVCVRARVYQRVFVGVGVGVGVCGCVGERER